MYAAEVSSKDSEKGSICASVVMWRSCSVMTGSSFQKMKQSEGHMF